MHLDQALALPRERKIELLQLLGERQRRKSQRLFHALYPDDDDTWDGQSLMGGLVQPGQILHARHKYPRHLEFFEAGATHRERCAMMANRSGKTFGLGGYETSCHLTGLYPDWWIGRRFKQPISAWAAGDTLPTTRDIVQMTLLGQVEWIGGRKRVNGHGVIPGDLLGSLVWHQGVQDLIDTIFVKHVPTGGWSQLGFKAYDQGRKVFQGTGRHVIWLDEEPPVDVYGECLMRTATVGGIIMLTFTPLLGLSEVVLSFLPADQRPDMAA